MQSLLKPKRSYHALVALGFLAFTFSTMAAAVELVGVSADMDIDAQISALEEQGYQCTQRTNAFGNTTYTCRVGAKTVRPGLDRIRFSCEVFEGCELSSEMLAQKLATSFLGDATFGEFEFQPEQLSLVGSLSTINKYCSHSTKGHSVCVIENVRYTSGEVIPEVELARAPSHQSN